MIKVKALRTSQNRRLFSQEKKKNVINFQDIKTSQRYFSLFPDQNNNKES